MAADTRPVYNTRSKPELVLPAGDAEKLQTALLFGADAVYVGGRDFSLRAYAGNLSLAEMESGLIQAHAAGKRIYVAVNILARNRDLDGLPAYLEALQDIGIDGVIISDLGVMSLARRYAPQIPITVSTQASVSNYAAAAQYRDLGARRIVLARELNLAEITEIKRRVDIEVEIFVHGAMCVSYSGRCLLSHYMTGRSANLGACAHPCRYRYYLMEEKRPGQYFSLEEDQRGSYVFNSSDLCLLEYLPQLIDAGIDAFKVEGRMKSPLYVATVASVYRRAIDRYLEEQEPFSPRVLATWQQELLTIATRPYTSGFVPDQPTLLQDTEKQPATQRADFCGIARAYDPVRHILEVEQRGNFGPGEVLEFLRPDGSVVEFSLVRMWDADGAEIDRARHPLQRVFMMTDEVIPVRSILRRRPGSER